MALYEALGYQTMRAGASLGVWDFVAWNHAEMVFCQVKTGRWPSPAEMERMKEAIVPWDGVKVVHRWMPRKRLPDVKEV